MTRSKMQDVGNRSRRTIDQRLQRWGNLACSRLCRRPDREPKMSTTRSSCLVAGLVLIVLLLGNGCVPVLTDPSGGTPEGGWYIKLSVGEAAESRGLTVTQYDVTALEISVHGPDGETLRRISWEAADGPQSYMIEAQRPGEHEIVVTHFGERGGQEVEATESAAFTIGSMAITVIDIVPGSIGVIRVAGGESLVDLTGYWAVYELSEEGEVEGPILIRLDQTDSTVDGYYFTGTIDDSTLTIHFCWGEDYQLPIESEDRLGGEGGWWERVTELTHPQLFGFFWLGGIAELEEQMEDTDQGLGRERDDGDIMIVYIGDDSGVSLKLKSDSGSFTEGTFSVPDDLNLGLKAEWEAEQGCGDGGSLDDDAVSGTLVVEDYEPGRGIKAHFEDMQFSGGTISGSFDVSFGYNQFWTEFPES